MPVDGEQVELTYREFELVAFLVASGRRPVPRDLHPVWGLEFLGHERTVHVHVRRLRAELGPHACRIRTLRGVGYRFEVA